MAPLFSPSVNRALLCLSLLAVDSLLSGIIIARVPYTEIDWVAYMQEVEGYLSGERNYANLKGDTGPCVYPAFFLHVFSLLYHVTSKGTNLRLAQAIFAAIYLGTVALVFMLYCRCTGEIQGHEDAAVVSSKSTRKGKESRGVVSRIRALLPDFGPGLPAWCFVVIILSKRIHSIYMLRMFNDCVAVLLGYAAFALFSLPTPIPAGASIALAIISTLKAKPGGRAASETTTEAATTNATSATTNEASAYARLYAARYPLGCVLYSLAVGVKMNMLLYAPGLLFLLLLHGLPMTFACLSICAGVQLLLLVEFRDFWQQYLLGAFDFRRRFEYKWTVNWRFLGEAAFSSPALSLSLLALTLVFYAIAAARWTRAVQAAAETKGADRGRGRGREVTGRGKGDGKTGQGGIGIVGICSQPSLGPALALAPAFTLNTLFSSNLIGVAFSRTLHYQFYCWHFFSLPLLMHYANTYTNTNTSTNTSTSTSTNTSDYTSLQALLTPLMPLLLLLNVEVSFNTYPSTAVSSLVLTLTQACMVVAVLLSAGPRVFEAAVGGAAVGGAAAAAAAVGEESTTANTDTDTDTDTSASASASRRSSSSSGVKGQGSTPRSSSRSSSRPRVK